MIDNTTKTRLVLDISRMTVHNGPGIRTLIQFKGCPLRCIWCSTPESQSDRAEIAVFPQKCTHCNECLAVCPYNAVHLSDITVSIDRSLCDGCGRCASVCYSGAICLLGRKMPVEELVREVMKDEVAYRHSAGGVTLSGGEPLLDMEYTIELLRSLSRRGVSVGVDTSGFVASNDLELALPLVDFFLWDVKIMDEQKHKEFTGVSNRPILDNLRLADEKGVPVYLRIPLIPGYTDSTDNMGAICEFAKGLTSLVEIDLLPVHHLGTARYASLNRPYPLAGVPLIPDGAIADMKSFVESYGLDCKVVG